MPADTSEVLVIPPRLQLDDYAHRHGLFPNVVKMDIEGEEGTLLVGFRDVLTKHKLYLILALNSGRTRIRARPRS